MARRVARATMKRVLMKWSADHDAELQQLRGGLRRMAGLGVISEKLEVMEVARLVAITDMVEEAFDELLPDDEGSSLWSVRL